jgi:hypothetical protein
LQAQEALEILNKDEAGYNEPEKFEVKTNSEVLVDKQLMDELDSRLLRASQQGGRMIKGSNHGTDVRSA